MGGLIDKITEFIKELLQGWVLTNFETMFTDVNDKVGTIAGEVSKTPSTWNSGIFDMIKTLSDNVMIPIAGMIISFVLVYELISMVIDKNNLHDFNTAIFIRFFMKACIAVMLLSKTFDIVMAVFDVGSHIVNSAAAAISGETSIDVTDTLQTMFNDQFSEMSIGELLGLGMETMIVSLCMKIMSVLITVILYGRMIEIYLYVSVAPVPCATVTNREWGTIGTNYFKGLCALAFQGFFMMVCVEIYLECALREERYGNIRAGAEGFVRYQDKSGTELNKETDHLFQRCGSSRDTLVFFNQGTDRNISRITSYDGSNASILLFCNV